MFNGNWCNKLYVRHFVAFVQDDGTQNNRAVQINKHRGKVSAHIPINIIK